MGTSPPHNIGLPILCLICPSIFQFSVALANSFAPVNVRYYTLNMNLSILWDPPQGNGDPQTIRYTVVRDTDTRSREEVPDCVNILQTSCSLLSVFPTGGEFRYNEYFYVESAFPDGSGDRSHPKRLNRNDIDISPPIVYKTSVSSRDVAVYIHGPETPYMREGRPIYMGDAILAGKLGPSFLIRNIEFEATLYEANSKVPVHTQKPEILNNGFGEIRIEELHPYTNYTLKIKCRIPNYRRSDNTALEFRTEADVPDSGPEISGIEVTRRYCDYRDVDISWKDIEKPNGPLTSYIVDFKNREINETRSVTVPAVSNRTALMTRLYRWHKYDVTVSAANEKGRTEGQGKVIEEDTPLIETYKPTLGNVTELPEGGWQLTWVPPMVHNQCIVGYRIVTHIGGTVDEETMVHGANASSAILHFTRSGRYQIDISPVINDSAGTEAFTTGMYSVENAGGAEYLKITLLAAGGLVVVILFLLVVIMFRKVFCDLSALPDISRSRTMKIVKDIRPGATVLRKPPEKEIFDSTRIAPGQTESCESTTDDLAVVDDDIQPRSSSSAPLLSSFSSSDSEPCSHPQNRSMPCRKRHELSSSSAPSPQSGGQSGGRGVSGESSSPPKRRQKKRRSRAVKSASTNGNVQTEQQSLTLYIPTQRTAASNPSPTSSCDSGISATTYAGSLSDYAPSTPLSEVDETSEWEGGGDSSSAEQGSGGERFASPYVTVDVAVHVGRVSMSSSSGVNSAGSRSSGGAYKRIDSRETAKGYLPMTPANGVQGSKLADST